MASAREIQSRMQSIKDTMKITSAMYMISSSKMQKAKKSLADTEPFFFAQQNAVARFMKSVPDTNNIFFGRDIPDDRKKRGYLVITADKGLAGAYNHNVLKLASEQLEKGGQNKLFVVGELGRQYFMKKDVNIDGEFSYTVQNPTLYRARHIGLQLIDEYVREELDEVYIIYTKMINAWKNFPKRIRQRYTVQEKSNVSCHSRSMWLRHLPEFQVNMYRWKRPSKVSKKLLTVRWMSIRNGHFSMWEPLTMSLKKQRTAIISEV